MALGLALRLAFALAAQNTHHPDEVFQYLEQAHRLVFGYGVIPWEFRFGTRSWLLPLAIAALLRVCQLLGLDHPTVYVPLIKGLFCLLSLSLIWSAYRIGRNLVSEAVGRLAALFACFWYELVYFAPRPIPDVVGAYFLVAALACVTEPPERRRPVLFGLCVATAVILRMQYLPVAGFLVLLTAATWTWPAIARAAGASVGMVLLAGALDRLTWGGWFASYYNNYVFNVTRGVSMLFGTTRPLGYVLRLTAASAGLFPVVGVLSLVFARRLWILLAWLLLVVGGHSVLAHKEYRFIFAALPILLIMTAAVTILVVERVMPARTAWARHAVTGALALISVAGMLGHLPKQHAFYHIMPLYAQQDPLRAFVFLRGQPDLAGVWLNGVHWWETGGYYHLHRNVPIYLPEEGEAMRRGGGPQAFVSHVLVQRTTEEVPGFERVAVFGEVEVLKQVTPRTSYSTLPSHSTHVMQEGVDDLYRPTVKPRF
jgi:hypothetical protein